MGVYYGGVDLHKKYSEVVWLGEDGEVADRKRIHHGNRRKLREEFSGYRGSKVAMEATVGWQWMADELERLGVEVHLAHPSGVPLIARSKLKSDKIDASVLAHLLRTNFLPEAYLAPLKVRMHREVLRTRAGLVGLRTSVKNRIHARLTQWGIFSEASDLFGKAGREMLKALELSPSRRKILDDLLFLVDTLDELIQGWDRRLKKMLSSNEEVELLSTMPGVGPIIAHTLIAEIGEIERFPSPRHLVSFAGLVPYTRQSGDRLWQGRLCKMGNRTMRTAMVEAAWAAIRCAPQIRQRYEYLRYKKGPQTAIIAVARAMLQIVWHMLTKRKPYKPFPGSTPPPLSP